MNALETVNQAEINISSKMVESIFKLGRYNRTFLEMWVQIPIWAPMLKQWAVGSFFLRKYSRKSSQKFIFFIKTSKWEKWSSWWLRMTNAFILCNLLWKVQKSLAAKREGSFNIPEKFFSSIHVDVDVMHHCVWFCFVVFSVTICF